MPQPLALCIEDVDASASSRRYLRCVALVGRQPGLRLDAQGEAHWRTDREVACELWVSADDRLILWRPAGAVAVGVHRAGRSLEVPPEKPVVLMAGDEITTGSRRLRVHIHGPAPAVAPPSPLPEQTWTRRAGRVAAVVAMGAAVGGCKELEVRQNPPDMAEAVDADAASSATTASATTTATRPSSSPTAQRPGQPTKSGK